MISQHLQKLTIAYQNRRFSSPAAQRIQSRRETIREQVYFEYFAVTPEDQAEAERMLREIKTVMGLINRILFLAAQHTPGALDGHQISDRAWALRELRKNPPRRISFVLGYSRISSVPSPKPTKLEDKPKELCGVLAYLEQHWGVRTYKKLIKQHLRLLESWGLLTTIDGVAQKRTPFSLADLDITGLMLAYEALEYFLSDTNSLEYFLDYEGEGMWDKCLPQHKGNMVRVMFNKILGKLIGWFKRIMVRDADEHYCGEPTMQLDFPVSVGTVNPDPPPDNST